MAAFIYLIKETDNYSFLIIIVLKVSFFFCEANVLAMHVTCCMFTVIFASARDNCFLGRGGIFRALVIKHKLWKAAF